MSSAQYNLKTGGYKDIFLDAYGRKFINEDGLKYFTELIRLTEQDAGGSLSQP